MKKPTELLGVKTVGGLQEVCTPWAGVSLLVDLYRKLEMEQLANKILPAKKTSKGLKPGQMVESYVPLPNTLIQPFSVLTSASLILANSNSLNPESSNVITMALFLLPVNLLPCW